MKDIKGILLSILFATCMAGAALETAWLVTGCSILQTHVSTTTAQSIVDDANKTIQVADAAAASFLQLEQEHRDTLLKFAPEVRQYAHKIRQPVPDPTQIIPPGGDGKPPTRFVPRWTGWLMTARAAVRSFEANRTTKGEADLNTALAVIREMITDCSKMTEKASTATP